MRPFHKTTSVCSTVRYALAEFGFWFSQLVKIGKYFLPSFTQFVVVSNIVDLVDWPEVEIELKGKNVG